MKVSGIYKIINRISGKYYVGSSISITGGKGRWTNHRGRLKHNRHENYKLQHDWNEYGENGFDFVIVESCESDKLKVKTLEQKYLDIAKTEQDKCYNLNFNAFGTRYLREESIKRIRKSLQGRIFSDESKRRMSEARKGVRYSKETLQKMCEAKRGKNHPLFGKHHSVETKEKMSLSKVGNRNHTYDKTIRRFVNKNTNEVFEGTQYELSHKFNLNNNNVNMMVNGKKYRKSVGGWSVKHSQTL